MTVDALDIAHAIMSDHLMTSAGIIFDLDGTLVDSERVAQDAGVAAFTSFGMNVDFNYMLGLVGHDWVYCQNKLEQDFGPQDFDAVAQSWRSEVAARREVIVAKPGAVEVLSGLRSRGIPVGVATSSRRVGAEFKLDHCGMAELVQAVVAREDVTCAKPDAEPFETAAKRLGVAKEHCLGVEDSHTGVASALAAGMCVLQVPDLMAPLETAHYIADDLLSGLQLAGVDLAESLRTP